MTGLVPSRSGWTKTPNRYLEELARAGAGLPARHRSILDLLVRDSLGWHRQAVRASQRAIASKLGVSERTVREALGDLERWRVVRRSGGGRGRIALLELLDPAGWRISRTAGAIRRAEARRRSRVADQPLLPFDDVASVVDLPTVCHVTSRDRRGGIPRRCRGPSLIKKRKKEEGPAESSRRGRIPGTLSRPGDGMPNDDPQKATPLERALVRRMRAARSLVRRREPSRVFDEAFVEEVASGLSDAAVEEEIARREAETEAARLADRHRREVENMRHEGRR